MIFKYSGYTWFYLLGMIITGAARSIVVKLAYQSGFKAPLTITLLYLLGQSLSLFVYGIQKWFANKRAANEDERTRGGNLELSSYAGGNDDEQVFAASSKEGRFNNEQGKSTDMEVHDDDATFDGTVVTHATVGSKHGLSSQSEERIRWLANLVPYYAKPAIPALFNMLNSALRWASLVHIDASVAEMMISGLELTLSVVAARIFRKRMVAKSRWVGVIIVAIGVIIIERANNHKHQNSYNEETDDGVVGAVAGTDLMFGVVLIVLQSILSVLQDIGEEIFMQAADFPATMMLGLEGLYGFCVGLVIYSTVADQFGVEDIDYTLSMLSNSAGLRWWVVGLPFLFLLTGIFNIKATEVTSAMTRNVWKNLRTVLVWIMALCFFYLGSNSDYGEAWHQPGSFYILFGFIVMSSGIIVYYWYKSQEGQPETMANGKLSTGSSYTPPSIGNPSGSKTQTQPEVAFTQLQSASNPAWATPSGKLV